MEKTVKIIHLSDFHVNNTFDFNIIKKDFFGTLSNSIVKNDVVFSFFTGDLSDSGKEDEFSVFEKFLREYNSFITQKSNQRFNFIIPGNHDCDFDSNDKLSEYYEFASRTNDISRTLVSPKRSIYCKEYKIDGKTILVAALNSAESCNSDFNDSGKLKLNSLEIRNFIDILPLSDYKILLLHHQFGMFDSNSKDCLDELYEAFDIVFDGHEHTLKNKEISRKGISYVLFDGGEFWNKNDRFKNCSFGIYSLLKETILQKTYIREETGFKKTTSKSVRIKLSGSGALIKRADGFDREFFADDLQIFNNYLEGFVDVELCNKDELNSESRYSFSFADSIAQIINDVPYVALFGKDFTCKTTLLKYIYKNLGNTYIPLFLKRELFFGCKTSKDIERILISQFNEQYDYKSSEIDNIPNEKIIILLDDYDKIPSLLKESAISILTTKYKHVVLTSTYDPFEKRTDLPLEKAGFKSYLIEDISHKTILSLIKTSINRLCENDQEEYNNEFCDASLNILDNNLSSYKHTPFFVRNIAKFVFFNKTKQTSSAANFSVIFDTNIKRLILDKFVDKVDFTETVINCLSDIAYSNYIINSQYFSLDDVEESIKKTLSDKDILSIDSNDIKQIILDTHLITKKGDKLGFENRITYAYFVATKVEELSGYDSTGKFDYDTFTEEAVNNIFVSINSEVLLFLIYKKYDINLIKKIMNDSENFFESEKNYNCINQQYVSIGRELDASTKALLEKYDTEEYKKTKKRKKEIDEQNEIFEGLSYSELDKKYYSCLNYLRTLGTAFSGLYERLDKTIKDELIDKLFDYPNIFVNFFLDEFDAAVSREKELIKEGKYQSPSILSLPMIKEVKKAMVVYAYDYLSRFCSNEKTIPNLMRYDKVNENYIAFEKLMFAFYSKEEVFKKQLVSFTKKYKSDPMCLFLSRLTFYRYIERTGKYDLGYNTNLLDYLNIKKEAKKKFLIKEHKKK